MSVQTEVREIGQCRTTAVTIEISYWPHIRESPARPRRQVSGARVPPSGSKSHPSLLLPLVCGGPLRVRSKASTIIVTVAFRANRSALDRQKGSFPSGVPNARAARRVSAAPLISLRS
jgi:hypothetical protein